MKRAKKYLIALEKVDHEKLYGIEEARNLLCLSANCPFAEGPVPTRGPRRERSERHASGL